MPTIQPAEQGNIHPLAAITGGFAKRSRENELQSRESDALAEIYNQYKQDGDLLAASFNTNMNPNLSPTTRVNTANQLLKFSEINANKKKQAQKDLDEKTKLEKIEKEKDEKRKAEQASVKSLYLENDYTEEEADRLSKFDTPTIAQAKVRERNLDKRANKKNQTKIDEENNSKIVTQKAFDDLANLIPKVGRSGVIQSKFGYGSQPYAEFSSLTGALESLLVEKVNKGALSNTRFRYITETLLPKPSDTQSEIKGKLKGLATILELDPSALLGKDEIKENKDPHKGMVQVRDPQGILRWVPKEVADKMKGG